MEVCWCSQMYYYYQPHYAYFYFFVYSFIFGCDGSLLLCVGPPSCGNSLLIAVHACHGARVLWHAGFSSSSRWAQQLWLSALEHENSVFVAQGLSFPVVCGIFLELGLKLCLLHWTGRLNHWPPGNPVLFTWLLKDEKAILPVQIIYPCLFNS